MGISDRIPKSKSLWLICVFILFHFMAAEANIVEDFDADSFVETEEFESTSTQDAASTESPAVEEEDIAYATPKPPPNSYMAETFDDIVKFSKTWIKSQAKKDGVDAEIAKYDGVWSVEEPVVPLLKGDRGLVLKSKAKHAAISAPLSRPFKFGAKPFVVQYDVTLQEGQECGGAYLKLLSLGDGKLTEFQEKTPYTIMFGPDKCGNDFKMHFIFRHVNPLNGSIEEKHAKRPLGKFEDSFSDKRPHLYTLIIRPDNTFEMSLDHEVINTGNLLEDFTPPVNPEPEIPDPNDSKPTDWDERETIPDPEDVKPEDWDDDAPRKIPDASATMPSGWLENEPDMIPDPEAVRPDDWDNEMDGEWEAPLINNPACSGAPGCGPWQRPLIDNPNFRGKWKPKQITNPNYRGVWMPQMIPNPNYFNDLEPFKMTPISAVGFELWSMSNNILFDNIFISDNIAEAKEFAAETFDLKIAKLEKGKGGVLQRFLDYSNERPWLYAIYVLLVAVPVVLVIMCCCASPIVSGINDRKAEEDQASRKKTDAHTSDDVDRPEGIVEEEEDNDDVGDDVDEVEDAEEEEDAEAEEEDAEAEEEKEKPEEENRDEDNGEEQDDKEEGSSQEEEAADGLDDPSSKSDE
ncbi:hypothetical protein HAZT_HAZT008986, partial [Hyalella azteca]